MNRRRIQNPEVRIQKPEARSQKSEVRSQKSEVRSQKSGARYARTIRIVNRSAQRAPPVTVLFGG
jgi:hypothetical protein